MKSSNLGLWMLGLGAAMLGPGCTPIGAAQTAALMDAGMGCTARPETSAVLNVEVVDASGPFRASNVITVYDLGGRALATLECPDAWAHFAIAPGRYRVMASLGDLRSEMRMVDVRPEGTRVTLMLQQAPGAAAEVAPNVVL
jgi:hypothetical protein